MKTTESNAMVVNLPKSPRKQQTHIEHLNASDMILVETTPTITSNEVADLLKDMNPVKIHLDNGRGHVRFPTSEKAECAYALFHKTRLSDGSLIQFKRQHDDADVPEPQTSVMCIQGLPESMLKDQTRLYDTFRTFGPLHICRYHPQQATALVQFYTREHMDAAQAAMQKKHPGTHIAPISLQEALQSMDGNHIMANSVDFTNLYIKNLDHHVKSSDLFSYFRQYGRIISARVIKDPETKQSKGYGFVSFSKMEEAHAALQEMNGAYIRSKPIIVSFHEPKKPRQDKVTRLASLQSSPFPAMHSLSPCTSSPSPPPDGYTFQDRQTSFVYANQPAGRYAPNFRHSKRTPCHKPYMTYPINSTSLSPIPTNLVSPYGVHPSPLPSPFDPQAVEMNYFGSPYARPSMMDMDRSMTDDVQLHRLKEAVVAIGEHKYADNIASILAGLKRMDRVLCIFNPDFLRMKIDLAKQMLSLPNSTAPAGHIIAAAGSTATTSTSLCHTPSLSSSSDVAEHHHHHHHHHHQHHQRQLQQAPANVQEPCREIGLLLDSLQGLSTIDKKKKLGDRLYPCVKATGIKHASSVTIWLLDHMPLEDLVYSMYDTSRIQSKVELATAVLCPELPSPLISA